MSLRDDLKQRRIELNLTMAEVADKVGVSEATISRWESGDIANMRRDKIALLAKALQVSPSFVMGLDDEPLIIRRLRKGTDKMDEKQQEKMMNILKASFEDLFDEDD